MSRYPCPTPSLCQVTYHIDPIHCKGSRNVGASVTLPSPGLSSASSFQADVETYDLVTTSTSQRLEMALVRRAECMALKKEALPEGVWIDSDDQKVHVDREIMERWRDATDGKWNDALIALWCQFGYTEPERRWHRMTSPAIQYMVESAGFTMADYQRDMRLTAGSEPEKRVAKGLIALRKSIEEMDSPPHDSEIDDLLDLMTGEQASRIIGKADGQHVAQALKKFDNDRELVAKAIESGIDIDEILSLNNPEISSRSDRMWYIESRAAGIPPMWAERYVRSRVGQPQSDGFRRAVANSIRMAEGKGMTEGEIEEMLSVTGPYSWMLKDDMPSMDEIRSWEALVYTGNEHNGVRSVAPNHSPDRHRFSSVVAVYLIRAGYSAKEAEALRDIEDSDLVLHGALVRKGVDPEWSLRFISVSKDPLRASVGQVFSAYETGMPPEWASEMLLGNNPQS